MHMPNASGANSNYGVPQDPMGIPRHNNNMDMMQQDNSNNAASLGGTTLLVEDRTIPCGSADSST